MDCSVQRLVLPIIMTVVLTAGTSAWAGADTAAIVLKNHEFIPRTLTLAAGKRVKLTVKNLDAMPAEFESRIFHAEKVVPGHDQIVAYIEPLEAGTYGFFDDFYDHTTTGELVVK
jgi:hypothetical protein